MKLIHFILAILLLSIGLFLSYEKVEIKKEVKIKEMFTGSNYQQASLEEATERDADESNLSIASEDDIKLINNNVKKESTKKDGKKTTTKKVKTNSTTKTNVQQNQSPTVEPDSSMNASLSDNITQQSEDVKPKEEQKPKEESKTQCSDFYESITHGKVDRTSKSACVSYGNKIQNNELDDVLDYNEENGNTRKPTISYFRCYEVVDSNCNTKGWYLHFFCNSGGCDDNKLKSLYG